MLNFTHKNSKTNSNSPSPESVISAYKKAGIKDPDLEEILELWLENQGDLSLLEPLLEAIDAKSMENLINPDPFRATNPTIHDDISGEIKLGIIPTSGAIWGIHPNSLCRHLLVVGRTGAGKSNLIKLIAIQIILSNET